MDLLIFVPAGKNILILVPLDLEQSDLFCLWVNWSNKNMNLICENLTSYQKYQTSQESKLSS
jgi:hypothetical protein